MKINKVLALAVVSVMMFSCMAYSAQPEDALSAYDDDSVYLVLRLEDTSAFLKWIFSNDNMSLFMPLVMKGKPKLQVVAASEFISTMVSMTPLRSAAAAIGITKRDIKLPIPFVQVAFKVKPDFGYIVENIAEGKAKPVDIAMLLIGSKIAATFAETMIKVEHEDDNILRVNNDIFMTAYDDLVILGSSANEIRASRKALADSKARLMAKTERKFSEKDFALLHVDYETSAELDEYRGLHDEMNVRKYFEKPLDIEFAFKRLSDKFTVSTALNLSKSLKKEYAHKFTEQFKGMKLTKGGNIRLNDAGNNTNPLAAIGTYLDIDALKTSEVWKPIIERIVRNLRVRFKISDEETTSLFTGPFSAVVNGTVTFEGLKLPAVYLSQTGQPKAAEKVFSKLTASQHFSKVQDGIFQLDSSLSPVSCLVEDKGEKLGVYFAELSSLAEKPSMKPALSELIEREAIASIWLDFAEIQSWINDDDNGVFTTFAPLATFAGYGKYVKAAREVLSAEFSVPSVSVWSETPEVFHSEFAVKDINVENGLFAKLINLSQELKALPKKD